MLTRAHPNRSHKKPSASPAKPRGTRSSIGGEGILAILVTDLESFTSLVDRLGDVAAQKLIQVHNRILRECVAEQLGGEVTHTGDGLITAFRSVTRALQCAIEIQRMLGRYNRAHHGSSLRVRIGLHAGEPLPEDGRLFGACVITAVRICALAGGGQVLVSDLIWRVAAGRGFDLRERGPAPLKGLLQPVDLSELRWKARS